MNKSEYPAVSVILLNYAGYEDTKACVVSLMETAYPKLQIIIVDNYSSEEERNRLKSDSQLNRDTIIIYHPENQGFSSGNNVGIRYALDEENTFCPEYILLLNNDTVVEKDFLRIMVEDAEQESKKTAIFTGCIAFFSEPEKYWYAGGRYDRKIGKAFMLPVQPIKEPAYVNFSTGCLMLIRAEYLREFGGLDESFFMYGEDVDYCLRAVDKGYQIRYIPDAKIYHKVSRSMGQRNDRAQYYLIRNNLYIISRYGTHKWYAYARRFLRGMREAVMGYSRFTTVVKAFWDFSRNIEGKTESAIMRRSIVVCSKRKNGNEAV